MRVVLSSHTQKFALHGSSSLLRHVDYVTRPVAQRGGDQTRCHLTGAAHTVGRIHNHG